MGTTGKDVFLGGKGLLYNYSKMGGNFFMKKTLVLVTSIILCLSLIIPSSFAYASNMDVNSYIVLDAETGYILYERNADIPYPPASITKIMTMYLIFEALENGQISKDQVVVPSEQVRSVQQPSNSQVFLDPGSELFTVDKLIQAIAVPSGSDAAIAMAELIAGSETNFVRMMNDKAKELGLTNTVFRNPHGLDAPGHVMSARDIAVLSQRLVVDFPEVTNYSSQQMYYPPSEQRNIQGQPYQPQPSTFIGLLRRHSEVDGLKTGFTSEAGYCITATANVGDRKFVIVIMGVNTGERSSSIRLREDYVSTFINSIASDFETLPVHSANQTIEEVSIPRARQASVPIGTNKDIAIVVPRESNEVTHTIQLREGLRAPLSQGEEVGTITYYVQEQPVHTAPLYALEDVTQANIFVRIIRGIGSFFSGIYNWIRNTFF